MSFLILVGSFSPLISTLNFTTSPPSLNLVAQSASGTSPTWLLGNPSNSSIVYATDETEDGALNSLLLDQKTGKLSSVASIPTQGGSPTHIGLVNNGTQLGVANYAGGSTFFTTLEADQLHFTNPQLVQFDVPSSNAHQVVPSGDQVFVADLAADRVWRLEQDLSSTWQVGDFIVQPSGSGPRHLVVDDDSLYTLHEKSSTLLQQRLPSSSSSNAQPDAVSSESIIPPNTPSSARLLAGELLFAQNPTPLLYASNRDDPSSEGDAIAIFELDPLRKVAEVRTGLKHLRGVALVGDDNAYLIAGGMNGGGIKIYERVSADQGYLRELAALPAGAIDQPASFIWIPTNTETEEVGNGTIASIGTGTITVVQPTPSRSSACRRFRLF